jgi:hypothetical protein
VAGRLTLASIIAIFCLTGCRPDKITPAEAVPREPQTCAELLQYLRNQNPSALESVEAWENEYGPGLKLATTHYEIFTTLLKPSMLRRIPEFVESAYRAYNLQLPEPVKAESRSIIYLFADRRQWEDFTRSFAGEQAELFCRIKAGAYYHDGACVAYDIGSERTLSVLGHEGWHQFNDRNFTFRLPSWLDEGVATLFEAHQFRDGAFQFDPADNRYRLEALKKTLDEDRMVPLEELIATTPGDVLASDQTDAVMAFYSQSYALMRFLREADSGRRLATYRRLLADGLEGRWPLDEVSRKIAIDRSIPRSILWNQIVGLILFQEYISKDFEPVEKEYLAFCRQITESHEDD